MEETLAVAKRLSRQSRRPCWVLQTAQGMKIEWDEKKIPPGLAHYWVTGGQAVKIDPAADRPDLQPGPPIDWEKIKRGQRPEKKAKATGTGESEGDFDYWGTAQAHLDATPAKIRPLVKRAQEKWREKLKENSEAGIVQFPAHPADYSSDKGQTERIEQQ